MENEAKVTLLQAMANDVNQDWERLGPEERTAIQWALDEIKSLRSTVEFATKLLRYSKSARECAADYTGLAYDCTCGGHYAE